MWDQMKIRFTMMKTGMRISSARPKNPKKEGMRTPDCSAMDLTMKLYFPSNASCAPTEMASFRRSATNIEVERYKQCSKHCSSAAFQSFG